jgi:hypothetical protein
MDMNSHGTIRIYCMDNTRFCASIRFHGTSMETAQEASDEFDWVWEDVIKERKIPTTALGSRT